MSLLPSSLLQKLGRTRLNVHGVDASTGIGERRSRVLGSGMEFADHRPYQVGDDLRHLDPHLQARLGLPFIRQYFTGKQLSITILLDASRSMAYGEPGKFRFGSALAAGLAYAGLVGGDVVLLGAFANGKVQWHPRVQGASRTAALVTWLENLRPEGTTDLKREIRACLPRVRANPGLTLVISDWFIEGIDEALAALALARQEIVAIHVLAPEEVEPERLGPGEIRLIDAELAHELDTYADPATYQRYHEALDAWTLELRDKLRSHRGRYLRVRSDDDLERVLTRDWRLAGLIA
jgi:uncharacterized protein (DUF58 family)